MGPAWMSYDTLRYAMIGYGYCMVSYDWHWRLGIELKACTVTSRFARRTAMAIGMRARDLCTFFGIEGNFKGGNS